MPVSGFDFEAALEKVYAQLDAWERGRSPERRFLGAWHRLHRDYIDPNEGETAFKDLLTS